MSTWVRAVYIRHVDRLPFTLGPELGRGMYGIVYEAQYPEGTHAVKVERNTLARKEFEFLRGLRGCRHVVGFIEAVEYEAQIYLVMERLVPTTHWEEWEECVEELRQQRVDHGDVRPENLMRDTSGVMKWIDFSKARWLHSHTF